MYAVFLHDWNNTKRLQKNLFRLPKVILYSHVSTDHRVWTKCITVLIRVWKTTDLPWRFETSDEFSRSSWASMHRVSKRLRKISQVKISWCLRAVDSRSMLWRTMDRSLMTVSNWNSRHSSIHYITNTALHTLQYRSILHIQSVARISKSKKTCRGKFPDALAFESHLTDISPTSISQSHKNEWSSLSSLIMNAATESLGFSMV